MVAGVHVDPLSFLIRKFSSRRKHAAARVPAKRAISNPFLASQSQGTLVNKFGLLLLASEMKSPLSVAPKRHTPSLHIAPSNWGGWLKLDDLKHCCSELACVAGVRKIANLQLDEPRNARLQEKLIVGPVIKKQLQADLRGTKISIFSLGHVFFDHLKVQKLVSKPPCSDNWEVNLLLVQYPLTLALQIPAMQWMLQVNCLI